MWSMKKEGMKESREMYLKAIYCLSQTNSGRVRHKDIADYLKVSRPSVSRAIAIMIDDHLVRIDENGMIVLTEEGVKEAAVIHDRYQEIVDFFKGHFDMQEEIIDKDACQIEHIISNDLYMAIKRWNGDDNKTTEDRKRR